LQHLQQRPEPVQQATGLLLVSAPSVLLCMLLPSITIRCGCSFLDSHLHTA
jgi:hypothetical protein